MKVASTCCSAYIVCDWYGTSGCIQTQTNIKFIFRHKAALKNQDFLLHSALTLPFGSRSPFSLNRTDWRWALCFSFISFPYNSLVMSHVTTALPWVSFNLRAERLHQRAILQRSHGINLAWKQLVMNLACLKSSLADSFHDQPSHMAVWFIPERHISKQKERGQSSVLERSTWNQSNGPFYLKKVHRF